MIRYSLAHYNIHLSLRADLFRLYLSSILHRCFFGLDIFLLLPVLYVVDGTFL